MNRNKLILFIGFALLLSGFSKINDPNKIEIQEETILNNKMKLGAFSVSLSVKDIEVSKLFYENLGFAVLGGDIDQKYLIMKNENSLIGLFQGGFDGMFLTFNPGWDEYGNNVASYDDIRIIQQQLKRKGISLINEADTATIGPSSMTLSDPDGNIILIDQHR